MTDQPLPDTQLPADLTARIMTEADIPGVLALERAMFPHDAWPEEMFRAELSRPELNTYLVVTDTAEPGETIIAYAGLQVVLPWADIQTIAVSTEHESRGIGTYLMTQLITRADRAGADAVLLEVRADNPRAQDLYRRLGFEHIHTRPGYYPPHGVDALIMRREFTRPTTPQN